MDFDVVSHVPYAVADSRENYGLPQKVRILFQLNYRKWIGHTCMQQVGALPPRKRKKEKKEKRKKKRRSIATQIIMSTLMLISSFVVLEYVPFILRLVFFFWKEWVLSEREEIDYWSKFNFFLTSKGPKKKKRGDACMEYVAFCSTRTQIDWQGKRDVCGLCSVNLIWNGSSNHLWPFSTPPSYGMMPDSTQQMGTALTTHTNTELN